MQSADDRKRWLIMLVLFAMGMMLFAQLSPKRQPQDESRPVPTQPQQADGQGATRPDEAAKPPSPTDIRQEGEARVIEVATDELEVRLSTIGAAVERVALRNFRRDQSDPAALDLLDSGKFGQRRSMVLSEFRSGIDFEHWPFKLESDDDGIAKGGEARTLVFRARQGDVEVAKAYVFHKGGFDIDLDVTVTNRGAQADTYDYRLLGAAGIVPDEPLSRWMHVSAKLAGRDSVGSDMEDRVVAATDAPGSKPEKLLLNKNRTEWAALRGRYFAAILAPANPEEAISAFVEPLDPEPLDPKLNEKEQRNLIVGVKTKSFKLEPGRSDNRGFLLRVGPQRAEDLEAYQAPVPDSQEKVSRQMVATVSFSWSYFDRFSRWMLMLLEWAKGVIGSYGWGIALMTLIVKLCLHPLTRKGTIIMQRNQEMMKVLGPKMKALQEQYKDDPAKLQQATMRMYKEEGFNPAGMALGCLPMMLQMPVWIALYGSIMGAFGLRQSGFLWVPDLSRPDTLYTLHLGGFALGLNLLPVLYAGLTVAQTFMTPLPEDPQQRSQAWMMRFMPLVFFFIIYSMPSAFVLYFAANAILGMGETWFIKKQIAWAKAKDGTPAAASGAAPASGAGAADGDASKPAPITDAATFWTQDGEGKRGKNKK